MHFFYFSGTFPASEYLFSAPQELFILVVISPLPSICAAPRGLLEDSSMTLVEFEYLRKVLVHGLIYGECLRKVLVHGLIYTILSTCARS